MIGTIEDLEKDIERFQNNIMASGELVTSLRQVTDKINNQNESFNRQADALLSRVDSVPETIKKANEASNQGIIREINEILAERHAAFSAEQKKYIDSLQQVDRSIKDAEEKLDKTYSEFSSTLEKFNISNLYEQNQQLKEELNKRTGILMAITAIGVIIGIIGLFI